MKKIFTLILVIMTFALHAIAQGQMKTPLLKELYLEYSQYTETSGRHRAPMRMDNIEAWYNAESNSINILYDGDATGEVFLYLNNNIIEYDSEINTSFQISIPGLYKIEIIGETWIAQGYIQL
ncbi:hypothetical protein [Duncaniella dubosii]|uniref:hypothetical protein n=1 Tax=Duncaniella dubosii TaxID=2518971 RepID=UPI003F66B624